MMSGQWDLTALSIEPSSCVGDKHARGSRMTLLGNRILKENWCSKQTDAPVAAISFASWMELPPPTSSTRSIPRGALELNFLSNCLVDPVGCPSYFVELVCSRPMTKPYHATRKPNSILTPVRHVWSHFRASTFLSYCDLRHNKCTRF